MMQVMVIEDDPSLARLYREELEEAGFGVWISQDLGGAVASLRQKPVHILVTDLDAVRGRLDHWVSSLRQVHRGGVLLLGRGSRKLPSIKGLQVMDKTSDLSDLVSTLRGMAGSILWSKAAGSC